MDSTRFFGKAVGVNEELGLVFGYAAITKKDGEDYYDLQKDHFSDSALLDAATDFMLSKRVLGDMHEAADGRGVVFSFVLTEELAKAFGIETSTYGWLVGVKPTPAMFEKFKSGEYTGFSVGGSYKKVKVWNED